MRTRNKWTGKFLAAFFCTVMLCTGGNSFVSLAEEPSGPASDPSVTQNAKVQEEPVGPGAEKSDAQSSDEGGNSLDVGQAENSQTGNEQTQSGEQADGRVMSGGRLIDPNKPMIALTFDDGPYAPVGNRIMDTMEKHNGRATFFVVGNRVNSYQDEIRRMQNSGHEVANHSYSHKHLQKLGAAEIRQEIEGCNQAVRAVTGITPALVRLPGGGSNATVLANIHQPIILWNIDTRDWATRNADQTVAAVMGKVKDGDIVLMHELYKSTAEAAERIIPALSEQGYQLVTVSELIRFRGGAVPGTLYYKFPPK